MNCCCYYFDYLYRMRAALTGGCCCGAGAPAQISVELSAPEGAYLLYTIMPDAGEWLQVTLGPR